MTNPDNSQKKKILPSCGLGCPGRPQSKIERKWKEGYVHGPCYKLKKKSVEHENDRDTNCNWCTWNSHQRIYTGTEGFGNKRKSRDHPTNCIVEIGQNNEKCPRDLRRLAVTQTPVRNHRLKLVWENLKRVVIKIIIWYNPQWINKGKRKSRNKRTNR